MIQIQVSAAELLDRISILEIKRGRLQNLAQQRNVRHELASLMRVRDESLPHMAQLSGLVDRLKRATETLWDVEDDLRLHERNENFDDAFVGLARKLYVTNDQRFAVKRLIDELLGSPIMEEKSYADYG